jgi:hypothetical protein
MKITKHQAASQHAVMELWRRPGVDFDLPGEEKSTLRDLLELGGLFPLSKVMDRLPFSRNSLQKWSRSVGESRFGSCFHRVPGEEGCKAITVLVDIRRLNQVLESQVRPSPALQGE